MLTCDRCGARFTIKSRLNVHFTAIHEGKKDFKCNRYEATFSYKHANVHEGKKPFECNICNDRFTQKSHLIIHIKQIPTYLQSAF